ncbi:MAG TPA: hypothetical protein VG164_13520, partial [Trebonia sp.]|nr:hypothetical protein [Trebonia sp.]
SAPGCAQYDETDSDIAHPNAARPPGTSPWWPPVPGQPFSKCRPPGGSNGRGYGGWWQRSQGGT